MQLNNYYTISRSEISTLLVFADGKQGSRLPAMRTRVGEKHPSLVRGGDRLKEHSIVSSSPKRPPPPKSFPIRPPRPPPKSSP